MSSELGSYTPIPHSLAQEVGLVCAAVYGVVWRKCQMKEGICKASMDTLGTDINVDRATVLRNIKKLCKLGYLVDLTPDRRNAPHDYVLAKTVAECNSLGGESVAMGNSLKGESVAYSNSYKQSVAENNATVAQRNATVAESYLKIDSEETLKDTTSKEVGASPPKPIQKNQSAQTIPAIVVFVEVTGKYVLNNTQIKAIDERVGRSPPALDRWRKTVTAWQLRGYKINNVDGMLEWFKKGIPEYKNGATNGTYRQAHNSIHTQATSTDPDRIPSVNIYDDTG